MSTLRLFTEYVEDEYEETAELISAFALNNTKASEKELIQWKFDFLDIFDIGNEAIGIRYKADNHAMSERGIGESFLKNIVEENIDSYGNLFCVRFVMNEYGEIFAETEVLTLNNGGRKPLRRFFLVEFKGEYFITTVNGINEATMHYKDNRPGTVLGLQFDDIVRRFL